MRKARLVDVSKEGASIPRGSLVVVSDTFPWVRTRKQGSFKGHGLYVGSPELDTFTPELVIDEEGVWVLIFHKEKPKG